MSLYGTVVLAATLAALLGAVTLWRRLASAALAAAVTARRRRLVLAGMALGSAAFAANWVGWSLLHPLPALHGTLPLAAGGFAMAMAGFALVSLLALRARLLPALMAGGLAITAHGLARLA